MQINFLFFSESLVQIIISIMAETLLSNVVVQKDEFDDQHVLSQQ